MYNNQEKSYNAFVFVKKIPGIGEVRATREALMALKVIGFNLDKFLKKYAHELRYYDKLLRRNPLGETQQYVQLNQSLYCKTNAERTCTILELRWS